jgi:hypothetical protein
LASIFFREIGPIERFSGEQMVSVGVFSGITSPSGKENASIKKLKLNLPLASSLLTRATAFCQSTLLMLPVVSNGINATPVSNF